MVVFLANRRNLDSRRLHDRLKQRLESEFGFQNVRTERADPHSPGPYRAVVEMDPRVFFDDQSSPTTEARAEAGFELDAPADSEHYWINWIEPERRLLVGWHRDDTHSSLGPVHRQINNGSQPAAHEPATFVDSHPLDVFLRRVDTLPGVVDSVQSTDWVRDGRREVVPEGFEPSSLPPEGNRIGRYPTGLLTSYRSAGVVLYLANHSDTLYPLNTTRRPRRTVTSTGCDRPGVPDTPPETDLQPDSDPAESELRTIGVLGGMSPASTTHYYERIVAGVNNARGGHTSAPVVVYSVDFGTVAPIIDADDWDAAGDYLAQRAEAVAAAGADVLLLATNTMHRVADRVAAAPIPFVHIVDPVATAARDRGIETVGVLGTETTMAADFYRDRFAARGVDTVVPDADAREMVDRVIFEELVHGEIRDDSREQYLDVIADLRAAGAEAVVLGCTEIEMLIDSDDTDLPVFDTTAHHVDRAVELCLGERPLPE